MQILIFFATLQNTDIECKLYNTLFHFYINQTSANMLSRERERERERAKKDHFPTVLAKCPTNGIHNLVSLSCVNDGWDSMMTHEDRSKNHLGFEL